MSGGSPPALHVGLAPVIDLGEWLRAAGQKRRAPGEWDCCATPAQWAIDNGLADPMAQWRGAYDTDSEASDLIDAAGGLLALFRQGMTSAGIAERHGGPALGDIGVLSIMGHEAGAIFTGKRWCLVADRGLVFASVEPEAVLAAWCVHG